MMILTKRILFQTSIWYQIIRDGLLHITKNITQLINWLFQILLRLAHMICLLRNRTGYYIQKNQWYVGIYSTGLTRANSYYSPFLFFVGVLFEIPGLAHQHVPLVLFESLFYSRPLVTSALVTSGHLCSFSVLSINNSFFISVG